MDCLPQNKLRVSGKKLFLLPSIIVVCVIIADFFLQGGWKVCEEAVIRTAAGDLLFAGTREGRQALVGSIWWAPLPTMLLFMLKHIPFIGTGHLPSFLLSTFSFVLVLVLLETYLQRISWGKIWRFLLITALVLNDCFLKAVSSGSFGTMSACAVLLFAASMIKWSADFRLRYLVYTALSGACLLMLQFELGLWAFAGLVLLCADLAHRTLRSNQKEAIIILLIIPFLYVALLWVLLNWLIMGNPLYFVQTIRLIFSPQNSETCAGEQWLIIFWAIPSIVLFFVGIAKRQRHNFYLGVITMLMCIEMLFFSAKGMGFVVERTLPSIILLSAFCSASIHGFSKPNTPVRYYCLAILLFVIISWITAYKMPRNCIFEEKNPSIETIRACAKKAGRHVKIFVAGYKGLMLIPPAKCEREFVYTFDFDVYQVAREYPGQILYLLVHEPVGIAKFESLYVKYPNIYFMGASGIIYDSQWGNWRLFKIAGAMPPFRLK